MARGIQYQPVNNKEMTDAQEIHYAKEFKKADIAGGFRGSRLNDTRKNNSR